MITFIESVHQVLKHCGWKGIHCTPAACFSETLRMVQLKVQVPEGKHSLKSKDVQLDHYLWASRPSVVLWQWNQQHRKLWGSFAPRTQEKKCRPRTVECLWNAATKKITIHAPLKSEANWDWGNCEGHMRGKKRNVQKVTSTTRAWNTHEGPTVHHVIYVDSVRGAESFPLDKARSAVCCHLYLWYLLWLSYGSSNTYFLKCYTSFSRLNLFCLTYVV